MKKSELPFCLQLYEDENPMRGRVANAHDTRYTTLESDSNGREDSA